MYKTIVTAAVPYVHKKFHASVNLMFRIMIRRSRRYSYSSWPPSIRKGSLICLISFLWSYLNKNRVHKTRVSRRSLNITRTTGRSSKPCKDVFPNFTVPRKVCECGNYHNPCVKYVLVVKEHSETYFV